VTVNDEGEVAFAGRAEVEFTPEPSPDRIGTAVMTRATNEGWVPKITVHARFGRMDRIADVRLGMRDGFTLVGEDEEGFGSMVTT
jgi:hypothetical protein